MVHRACQRLEEVEAAFGGIDTVERRLVGVTQHKPAPTLPPRFAAMA